MNLVGEMLRSVSAGGFGITVCSNRPTARGLTLSPSILSERKSK